MIYLLIALFLFSAIILYDVKNFPIGEKQTLFLIFIILTLFSAFRYRVGGDSLLYEDFYPTLKKLTDLTSLKSFENDLSYQPLWIVFISITRTISEEYAFFQFVHAIVFNTILFSFVRKYVSKPFTYIFLFYISMLYVYYEWEIQRESLAVVFFLLNIKNLISRKWGKYYLLAFISYMFHQSAFILFFIPFLRNVRFSSKFIIITFIFALSFLLLRGIGIDIVRFFLVTNDMKLKYDIYSERNFNLNGIIVYFIIRLVLFLPLAFSPLTKNLNYKDWNWFFVIFTLISAISPFMSGSERFLNYFYPIYILVVVDFIYNSTKYIGRNDIRRKIILTSLYIQLFFVIEYKLFSSNKYGNYYSLFYPYVSIFDPVKVPEREYYNWNVAR